VSARRATVEDAGAIAALHRLCFATAWTEASFQDFVANDLVLVVGEPVAGFLVLRGAVDELEIVTLGTDPAARQTGLAKALLTFSKEQALIQGIQKLFLEVAEDNHAALNLYRTFGFLPIARRRGYYRPKDSQPNATSTDALVLSCDITCVTSQKLS
jgi:[ribosomal protein S18]-alanine N-acetyltransferase